MEFYGPQQNNLVISLLWTTKSHISLMMGHIWFPIHVCNACNDLGLWAAESMVTPNLMTALCFCLWFWYVCLSSLINGTDQLGKLSNQ